MTTKSRCPVQQMQCAMRRIRKPSFSAALAAGLIGSAFVASIAEAGDEKVYPGTFCHPIRLIDAGLVVYTPGRILHNNRDARNQDAFLSCPVVRDNTRNTNGVKELWVTGYRVGDGVENPNFSCEFSSTDHHGRRIGFDRALFPKQKERVVIKFTAVDVSREETGHYELFCRVPFETGIVEYEVDEN
jgi:hypothetical protein